MVGWQSISDDPPSFRIVPTKMTEFDFTFVQIANGALLVAKLLPAG